MSKIKPRTDSPKPYKAKKGSLSLSSARKPKNSKAEWQRLVKVLDKHLSLIIRARDEDKPCIDLCGDQQGIAQCGHFRPRTMYSTRFDPKNVNKQWRNCNYYRSHKNDLIRHERGIDERWGAGEADRLYKLSFKEANWSCDDLRELIAAAKKGIEEYTNVYSKLTSSM